MYTSNFYASHECVLEIQSWHHHISLSHSSKQPGHSSKFCEFCNIFIQIYNTTGSVGSGIEGMKGVPAVASLDEAEAAMGVPENGKS